MQLPGLFLFGGDGKVKAIIITAIICATIVAVMWIQNRGNK